MKTVFFARITAAALVLALAGFAHAGSHGEVLQVGEIAPDFTMPNYTGEHHTLSGYEGKTVVLVFASQECPWQIGADPDLKALSDKYAEHGVVFLAIDSHVTTTVDEITEYWTELEWKHPVLKDVKNVYADKVGATRTPEIFVLDGERRVVYHGAFDNRKVPTETGDVNYLADALDNVLAGEEVATKHVSAWGCTIKRAPKEEKAVEHEHGASLLQNSAPAVSAAVVPAAATADAEKCDKAKKAEGCEGKVCPVTGASLLQNPAPAVSAAVVPAAAAADDAKCDKADADCDAAKKAEKKASGCGEKAVEGCPAAKKACPAGVAS